MNFTSNIMNTVVSATKKVVEMFVCCVECTIAIPLYKIEYTKPWYSVLWRLCHGFDCAHILVS